MTTSGTAEQSGSTSEPRKETPWLHRRPVSSTPRFRLFCLPHAGGGSTTFRSWNAASLPDVQICSVLLPGREQRISEPLRTEFDPLIVAIARELRPWLDMPFAIFGHSMGSLLAFELVRRLARDRAPMPAWLFVSGRRAPDTEPDAVPMHSLPNGEFLEELGRRYEGLPKEIASDPDVQQIFLPILRADIAVVESYRFHSGEPLDCPITAFAGVSDPSATWQQLLAWKHQTRRRFAVHVLPGGHFYPPQPLLQTIAATLAGLPS